MKNYFYLLLARLNFLFPYNLGLKYIKYRRFLNSVSSSFDNTSQLLNMINYVISHIPYYKKLSINRIYSIEEFRKLIPLIDKDTIMSNWSDFVLPNYPKNKVTSGTTGGTSGKPLNLLTPKNRYVVEQNTMNLLWNNIEWNGEMRGVIRNKHLNQNEIYRVNPLKKEVIFDGFRTDDSYYEKVLHTLKILNIKYIHAYPSSAYQFCLFLKRRGKDTSFIKGILSGSEGLTDIQKELILDKLKIPIYNWYGHSEKLVLGGSCKGSILIHVEPTYGYFELIDDDENSITEVGKIGEIVGTTLHNKYMPFVRYRTGDFAEYAGNYCPYCKRKIVLIKNIQGRRNLNKIYLNDETYVSITALNLHSDLYNYIDGLQYIQCRKGELEIHLIKGLKYDENIEDKLRCHFNKSFNNKCDFKFIYTNKIENEPNGKFLPLKQFIKSV